jgi:hypothetical protein
VHANAKGRQQQVFHGASGGFSVERRRLVFPQINMNFRENAAEQSITAQFERKYASASKSPHRTPS